jgi:DNA helicase-4
MTKISRRFDVLVAHTKLLPGALEINDHLFPLAHIRKPRYRQFMFLAFIHFFSRSGVFFVWGFKLSVRDQFREMMRQRNNALQIRREKIRAEKERLREILKIVQEENKRSQDFLNIDFYISTSQSQQYLADSLARLSDIPDALIYHYDAKKLITFRLDFEMIIKRRNDAFVDREIEIKKYKDFFDHVESQSLTREQRIACVTFEDRVLLVAAAGSGKSSTLVAKIGYAILKGIVKPNEILALAFNSKAAEEVKERIEKRLSKYGDIKAIESRTFHSFGLKIIRETMGDGFAIAGVEDGEIIDSNFKILKKEFQTEVPKIYSQLLRDDEEFRRRALSYLAIFGGAAQDTSMFTSREEYNDFVFRQNRKFRDLKKREPKDKKKENLLPTLDGNEVHSPQLRMICDWLFVNGIPYHYRHPSANLARYLGGVVQTLDFYYPEIEVWHDHFHINSDGKADSYLGSKYAVRVQKKKEMLARGAAKHFTTSNAMLEEGDFFEQLEKRLRDFGLNPSPISAEAIERSIDANYRKDSFTDTIATFVGLWKGGAYSREDIEGKAKGNRRFLEFIWLADRILSKYEQDLKGQNAIDFSDMINDANTYLRANAWTSPYKLILVDEFQDISRPRSDLVRLAINQVEGSFLFGVGDDWQAINGFAGSELAIMRSFQATFGPTAQLYLTQTFRSNQGIASAASSFVMKNPAQFKKEVRAIDPTTEDVIRYIDYEGGDEGLDRRYPELVREILELRPKSVKILCRTHKRIEAVRAALKPIFRELEELAEKRERECERRAQSPESVPEAGQPDEAHPIVEPELMTMHKSKGLEADIVILDQMKEKKFPLFAVPDPVLKLVSPEGEPFKHAEFRRLFYVILTRARNRVYIMTPVSCPSPFIEEIRGPRPPGGWGKPADAEVCPSCQKGYLRLVYQGRSWGCSEYRASDGCRYMRWV